MLSRLGGDLPVPPPAAEPREPPPTARFPHEVGAYPKQSSEC
jgi:hypothetical protein